MLYLLLQSYEGSRGTITGFSIVTQGILCCSVFGACHVFVIHNAGVIMCSSESALGPSVNEELHSSFPALSHFLGVTS